MNSNGASEWFPTRGIYWVVVGLAQTFFAGLVLLAALPTTARMVIQIAFLVAIGVLSWYSRPAVIRKIKIRTFRAQWPYWLDGLAVLAIAVANLVIYSSTHSLWTVAVSAIALFVLPIVTGPALDRHWMRAVDEFIEEFPDDSTQRLKQPVV